MDGTSAVVESQVLDHLRLVRAGEGGLPFDLFIFGRRSRGAPSVFNPARRGEIERLIGGRLVARQFGHPLTGLMMVLGLLFRYQFPLCFTRRLIIHARAKDGGFVGALFKFLCLGRPRLIFDARGDIAKEIVFEQGKAGHDARSLGTRLALLDALGREWLALRGADRLFCHSAGLRREIIARRPFAARIPHAVFPCMADECKFRFDPALREATRAEFAIAPDERLMIYSGGLQSYQGFEQTVRLFALCSARQQGWRLLVAAPEPFHDAGRQTLLRHLALDRFILLAAPHDRIPALLNAADIGCILLEPSPRNRTTSPVKFAEHILCGLPVIITNGIGDYSAMTEEHDLGLSVENYEDLDSLAEKVTRWLDRHPADGHRRRIEAFGRERLSRSRRIPEYLSLYRGL